MTHQVKAPADQYITVTVYLNARTDFFHGYDPEDNSCAPVFTYPYPCSRPDDPVVLTSIAESAFVLLNVGNHGQLQWDEDRTIMAAYRLLQLRSLSIGDVIALTAGASAVYLAVGRGSSWDKVDPATMHVSTYPWRMEYVKEALRDA